MSRAFVKEDAGGDDTLPDRTISPHPNYVTAEGLALIDAELARLTGALAAAGDDRAARAGIERDLRYWRARHASAEVVAPPADTDEVRFGSRVTIERDDGRQQAWRIVGEDEADPARGTLSYVSPLAAALMGKGVGDVVSVAGGEAEIVAIG
ncbi:MAG TPA: transcription elongation factor GreA [Bauldia sp.]|nr:transcription elongation factor GreA [Bauldia sp.]